MAVDGASLTFLGFVIINVSVFMGMGLALHQDSLLYRVFISKRPCRIALLWLVINTLACLTTGGLLLKASLVGAWLLMAILLLVCLTLASIEKTYRSGIRAHIAIRKLHLEGRQIPQARKFHYLAKLNKIMDKYELWHADITQERVARAHFVSMNPA